MNIDWTEILKSLGVNAIILGVLGYVAKAIFSQLLSKDIDRFKLELETKHEKELSKFRADIQRLMFEHETRFSKLHEKQAEVIAIFYELLLNTQQAYTQLLLWPTWVNQVSGLSDEERLDRARKSEEALWNYFEKNQLYFDENLCIKLEGFHQQLSNIGFDYIKLSGTKTDTTTNEQQLLKIREAFSKEIPAFRKQIEKDFRSLLGSSKLPQDNGSA